MKGRPERSGPDGPSSRDEGAGSGPRDAGSRPGSADSGPGDADTGPGDAAIGPGIAAPAGARAAPGHLITALTGLREPIVVILLIIGFMSWISGKPLDGLLIFLVGLSLAWDTGRRARQASPAGASSLQGGGPPAPIAAGQAGVRQAGPRWRRPALLTAGLAAGVLYAVVVGSFTRYSWPATVPVAVLGAIVVAIGWRGPRHTRPAPPRPPAIGLALWAAVFVAACLWELWSLLEQPNLATSSYTHPTISALTDPVLSTWAGRSVVLAGWLGLGWFLVER